MLLKNRIEQNTGKLIKKTGKLQINVCRSAVEFYAQQKGGFDSDTDGMEDEE